MCFFAVRVDTLSVLKARIIRLLLAVVRMKRRIVFIPRMRCLLGDLVLIELQNLANIAVKDHAALK